jgi:hypothetical protein
VLNWNQQQGPRCVFYGLSLLGAKAIGFRRSPRTQSFDGHRDLRVGECWILQAIQRKVEFHFERTHVGYPSTYFTFIGLKRSIYPTIAPVSLDSLTSYLLRHFHHGAVLTYCMSAVLPILRSIKSPLCSPGKPHRPLRPALFTSRSLRMIPHSLPPGMW